MVAVATRRLERKIRFRAECRHQFAYDKPLLTHCVKNFVRQAFSCFFIISAKRTKFLAYIKETKKLGVQHFLRYV